MAVVLTMQEYIAIKHISSVSVMYSLVAKKRKQPSVSSDIPACFWHSVNMTTEVKD